MTEIQLSNIKMPTHANFSLNIKDTRKTMAGHCHADEVKAKTFCLSSCLHKIKVHLEIRT